MQSDASAHPAAANPGGKPRQVLAHAVRQSVGWPAAAQVGVGPGGEGGPGDGDGLQCLDGMYSVNRAESEHPRGMLLYHTHACVQRADV
jgi:hypothetical protein